ncbi:hypothetical protein [Sagittula sp. SSi028]|uniref:hypothetical protein n=1 Tax=Sagittula sp. SSi028 TaxID=3400636 RepID=UPI003AF52677
MKTSFVASALFAAALAAPTTASANYYTYQRCMNGGGNWFTCLGELAWDDGSIVAPEEVEETFGFLRADFKDGEDRVMETIKIVSEKCDEQKGKAKTACYQKGLKSQLEGK